jgi:hypothetical protein
MHVGGVEPFSEGIWGGIARISLILAASLETKLKDTAEYAVKMR